jgi:OOP family OmpA-OmpF porin
MIDRKMGWAVGLALAMAASTASAGAQDTGWYLGLNAGQATADVAIEDGDDIMFFIIEDGAGGTILGGESSLEDSDITWSIVGGYKLNPYIAVEASYIDLGTVEYRATADVFFPGEGTFPLDGAIDSGVTGLTAAAVGSLPLGESFDLHARIGVLFSETELEISISDDTGGVSEGDSFGDTEVFYGAGIAWYVGERWSLSLDYLLYKDVGTEDETGETDIDSVTLGLNYRF